MARLRGCTTRAEIISFGENNLKRLQKLGVLANGVPSQSTLCRIDQMLEAESLAESMEGFVSKHTQKSDGLKIIAMDGKCTKGTVQDNGKNPDIVSAFSVDEELTIASVMCEEKSNEIPAAKKLIDKLDLDGCVVTADAMFCQKSIIDKITEKGGHFLIEVKANQKALLWNIEDRLDNLRPLYAYKWEAWQNRVEGMPYIRRW